MKGFGLFLALVGVSAVLTGCSYMLDTTLFNNAGEEVVADWDLDGPTAIAAGQYSHFSYAVVSSNRKVRLSSKGCEYLYEVPPELKGYRPDKKLERGLQVQVEKDFSIDLLPEDYAGEGPASDNAVLKHAGFPLRPLAKKCG